MKKTGGDHPASFRILCAMDTKPHSVFTFFKSLR